MKIYLFRHGQTTFNRDERFTGFRDSKLTLEGKKHANEVARKLKNKKFQVAIQTHLSRSRDTLKSVLKYHPECKLVLEDDRMIERSYGSLSGKSHREVIEKYGQTQYDKWHRGYGIENRPPEGECFADVEKRVGSFIKDLKKFMRKNKVNVAISVHGNSIRLFRKIMERASRKDVVSWFIPYDKVFEYLV
ncbi:MAG: phosphoglycerate mutase family protein [Candidatus Heimdallarchaeota archaeon]|nr:phosphoglycerate mutase family protein [Candidatus Heimdallarchaeota archaeon]